MKHDGKGILDGYLSPHYAKTVYQCMTPPVTVHMGPCPPTTCICPSWIGRPGAWKLRVWNAACPHPIHVYARRLANATQEAERRRLSETGRRQPEPSTPQARKTVRGTSTRKRGKPSSGTGKRLPGTTEGRRGGKEGTSDRRSQTSADGRDIEEITTELI